MAGLELGGVTVVKEKRLRGLLRSFPPQLGWDSAQMAAVGQLVDRHFLRFPDDEQAEGPGLLAGLRRPEAELLVQDRRPGGIIRALLSAPQDEQGHRTAAELVGGALQELSRKVPSLLPDSFA